MRRCCTRTSGCDAAPLFTAAEPLPLPGRAAGSAPKGLAQHHRGCIKPPQPRSWHCTARAYPHAALHERRICHENGWKMHLFSAYTSHCSVHSALAIRYLARQTGSVDPQTPPYNQEHPPDAQIKKKKKVTFPRSMAHCMKLVGPLKQSEPCTSEATHSSQAEHLPGQGWPGEPRRHGHGVHGVRPGMERANKSPYHQGGRDQSCTRWSARRFIFRYSPVVSALARKY